MLNNLEIAQMPSKALIDCFNKKHKIRRTDKLYAMVDILRIASISPSVSRHLLLRGCQNLSRQYNNKTIERALNLLLNFKLIKYAGKSGKTNGRCFTLDSSVLYRYIF